MATLANVPPSSLRLLLLFLLSSARPSRFSTHSSHLRLPSHSLPLFSTSSSPLGSCSHALSARISSKADPPPPSSPLFTSFPSIRQTFQKEAIYRQMREYQRQHTRSSARVSELERRKHALEAGLQGVEVCWSEVSLST